MIFYMIIWASLEPGDVAVGATYSPFRLDTTSEWPRASWRCPRPRAEAGPEARQGTPAREMLTLSDRLQATEPAVPREHCLLVGSEL